MECYLRRNFLTDDPIIYEIVDEDNHVQNFGTKQEITHLLGTENWTMNSVIFLVYNNEEDYIGHYTVDT